MKKIIVNDKFNNKKIQNVLKSSFPHLTNSLFFKTLRKKDIKVNGKRITENILVCKDDVIEIFLDDKYLFGNIDFDIVYEDDNILIVNKPANIEVLSDKELCLTELIQKKYNNSNFPYPCHRLDRNTSGLVIYAKNHIAQDIINTKIKNHEIHKFYKCAVIGILTKKTATLIDYLFKDSKKSKVYISHTPKIGYKKIVTSYTVLSEDKINNTSLLEIELHTGRTHQIRAHLAYINHPIIGDGKYGSNIINKKFEKKYQILTAYKLSFNFETNSGILEYLNGQIFSI